MNRLCCILALSTIFSAAFAQGHNENGPSPKMKALDFLVGTWKGKQNFQMGGGQTMAADIELNDSAEVGGRFIQERSTTTMPGGRSSQVIHMLGFDPKTNLYKAWWFNDTSPVPMELDGVFDGPNLVLQTPDGTPGSTFRATYSKTDGGMSYKLELKQGEVWRTLFQTDYQKV